jgi:hypothetical protein
MKIVLKVILIIILVISIVSAQGDIAVTPDIMCNQPNNNKATVIPNGFTINNIAVVGPGSYSINSNIITFSPSDVTKESIFTVTIHYSLIGFSSTTSARCTISGISSIPEFPTIAIPIISIIGLMLLLKKR